MGSVLVIAFLLGIGPLALLWGVDSRRWDDSDRRRWRPGDRHAH
jgi:cbb3-type cytochrome oxidase maturation protein